MNLEQVIPAISLIAVLILVLPAFLKTNSKLKRDGYNNTNSNFLKKFKLKKSENVNLVDNKLFKVKV